MQARFFQSFAAPRLVRAGPGPPGGARALEFPRPVPKGPQLACLRVGAPYFSEVRSWTATQDFSGGQGSVKFPGESRAVWAEVRTEVARARRRPSPVDAWSFAQRLLAAPAWPALPSARVGVRRPGPPLSRRVRIRPGSGKKRSLHGVKSGGRPRVRPSTGA